MSANNQMKHPMKFLAFFILVLNAGCIASWLIGRSEAAIGTTIMWGYDYLDKYWPRPVTPPDITMLQINPRPMKYHFIMLDGIKGPSYEFGLRSDGVVVWREIKKP